MADAGAGARVRVGDLAVDQNGPFTPVRDRRPGDGAAACAAAVRDHPAGRGALHLQVLLHQANRTSVDSFRGPGCWKGCSSWPRSARRSGPFLMFTGLPAAQAASSRSVRRYKNAGTCSTSATSATAATSWRAAGVGDSVYRLEQPLGVAACGSIGRLGPFLRRGGESGSGSWQGVGCVVRIELLPAAAAAGSRPLLSEDAGDGDCGCGLARASATADTSTGATLSITAALAHACPIGHQMAAGRAPWTQEFFGDGFGAGLDSFLRSNADEERFHAAAGATMQVCGRVDQVAGCLRVQA